MLVGYLAAGALLFSVQETIIYYPYDLQNIPGQRDPHEHSATKTTEISGIGMALGMRCAGSAMDDNNGTFLNILGMNFVLYFNEEIITVEISMRPARSINERDTTDYIVSDRRFRCTYEPLGGGFGYGELSAGLIEPTP